MARKTMDELMMERQKIDARIRAINAKALAQKRKDETRRKILAGAVVLNHAKHDSTFGVTLQALLDSFVAEDRDRLLFALPVRANGKADAAPEARNDHAEPAKPTDAA